MTALTLAILYLSLHVQYRIFLNSRPTRTPKSPRTQKTGESRFESS